MPSLRNSLLEADACIGVWGVGYIGCSTMAYYADAGVRSVGYDIDAAKVGELNSGVIPIPGLESWFDFDATPLISAGLMSATTDITDILNRDVPVHFICVPTETAGKPNLKILELVCGQLADAIKSDPEYAPLIIIESTLTPSTTERVVLPTFESRGLQFGVNYFLGVAPRRDWFVEKGQSLRNLDRVYGGVDEASAELTHEVLNIVCDTLHRASSHEVSEMVKCVENAYRHMEITLANQLSLAYPNVDVRELLQLAGTKRNVGTYHPSFGTGGYCIPLSSQYVLDGASRPEELTLLSDTVGTDRDMRERVAESLVQRGVERVAILGLSYRGNLKVSILSPTIGIADGLKRRGVDVAVHDPYYSPEEIESETNTRSLEVPGDLDQYQAILITADHRQYATKEVSDVVRSLPKSTTILDNYGLWSSWKLRDQGFQYYMPGEPNWLG